MKKAVSLFFALTLLTLGSLSAEETSRAALLAGAEDALIKADGTAVDASVITGKKYLFIYFSAHWCSPCRAFTPRLVDFYQKHSANGDFELLFVSSDRDQKGMNEYMTGMNMPWPGLKLKNKQTAALKKQFGVKGIPCLVLLDENNEVLATSYTADGKYLGPQVALKKYQALHGR